MRKNLAHVLKLVRRNADKAPMNLRRIASLFSLAVAFAVALSLAVAFA
jgi:hypothetical protein